MEVPGLLMYFTGVLCAIVLGLVLYWLGNLYKKFAPHQQKTTMTTKLRSLYV